jgi:Xaa-Pro aminopeptidase
MLPNPTSGRELDVVTRAVIEKAGYGEAFNHQLGHGIGLQFYEALWLHPVSRSPGIREDSSRSPVVLMSGIHLPTPITVCIKLK